LCRKADAEKRKVAHVEEEAKKATIRKQLKEEEAKKKAEQRAEMVNKSRGNGRRKRVVNC